MASVADELAYDALPEDVKRICEAKIEAAAEQAHFAGFREGEECGRVEGFRDGHKQGFAEGRRAGREQGRADLKVELLALLHPDKPAATPDDPLPGVERGKMA